MSAMPVLWIVWAGVAVILLILLGYRTTLTRYEDDRIFLDDAEVNQQHDHDALLLKLQRVQPWVRLAIAATCVMSACIIGLYIWDALKNLS